MNEKDPTETEEMDEDNDDMPLDDRKESASFKHHEGHKHNGSKDAEVKKNHSHHQHEKKTPAWIIITILVAVLIVVAVLVMVVFPRLLTPQTAEPPGSDVGDLKAGIAATVNGQPITEEELNKQYELYFFLSGIPDSQKDMLPKSQFLSEYLVVQKLLSEEAEKQGVDYSYADAEAFVSRLFNASPIPFSQIEMELSSRNISRTDFITFYQDTNRLAILINETVFKVKPVELPERIRASHIYVRNETIAADLLQQLKSGTSFEALASQYNMDATKETAGDLGYFVRGQMVPEFENAAFALQEGQVSDVVQTQFGFHIIKVSSHLEAEQKLLTDISDPSERVLAIAGQRQAIDDYISELRSTAKIVFSQSMVATPTPSVVESAPVGDLTFMMNSDPICRDAEGKPIARVFTTSWCPHCQWIKDTVDAVLKDYADRDLITAYHWEVDTGKELVTGQEGTVPDAEMAVYQKYNPDGSIPTFIFGCRYVRVGTGYEQEDDLGKEKAEFELILDTLLAEEAPAGQAPSVTPVVTPAPTVEPTAEDSNNLPPEIVIS